MRHPSYMKTFSLLQRSLDQTIDLASLEAATIAEPSIARADCRRIHRELFGIMLCGLERGEAETLRVELSRRNFLTDLVADDDLPVLREPFTIQRLDIVGLDLVFADALGHVQTRPLAELDFLAAGFMERIGRKSVLVVEGNMVHDPHQPQNPLLEVQYREEAVREFRLDFFFSSEPPRLRCMLNENNVLFYNNQPLRLRHTDELLGMIRGLNEMLPPGRSNQGLKRTDTATFYPNLHCYEREIRWHFHRHRLDSPRL